MEILARKSWIAGMAVLTACFFALLLMNDLAYADITATTGEVHEGDPPASVELNQHEHDDDTGTERRPRVQRGARLRHESADRPRRVHDGDVRVRHLPGPRTGLINEASDLTVGTIRANSCIDSHMVRRCAGGGQLVDAGAL